MNCLIEPTLDELIRTNWIFQIYSPDACAKACRDNERESLVVSVISTSGSLGRDI